jgi:hypothetical protein
MTGYAAFAEDATVTEEGAASVRVALHRADAAASVSIVPPNAGVQDGTRVSVRAWVGRGATSGSVFLVVEWLDAGHHVLRRAGSTPLHGAAGAWEQLRVAARAPHRAAYARIELVVRGTTDPVWFDGVSFSRG